MSFRAPMSGKEVLSGIHSKEYLLPAIQREFVWDGYQIRRLVDSLMRQYPIGSFLLWKVEPGTARGYVFYDFLTDYRAKNNPYAAKAVVPPGRSVLAILDGQQRLTALNIAVYGSLAVKKPYAWWSNPDAFPKNGPISTCSVPPTRRLPVHERRRLCGEPDPAQYGTAAQKTVLEPLVASGRVGR
jgi:uncharacterized protein with ParB-like and HNH nuclease domain